MMFLQQVEVVHPPVNQFFRKSIFDGDLIENIYKLATKDSNLTWEAAGQNQFMTKTTEKATTDEMRALLNVHNRFLIGAFVQHRVGSDRR